MDSSSHFHLSIMPICRARIQTLAVRAKSLAYGVRFAVVLTSIRHQLETNPRNWGDPNFRFHGLDLVSYLRVEEKLRVVYAVHETNPVVFLRELEPLPGHPLAAS